MKAFNYTIKNPFGIHARPAALLVQCCVAFKSAITFEKNGEKADGKNVLEIIHLAAKKDDEIKVVIDGEDEDFAFEQLQILLNKDFNQKKASRILKIAFFGTKDYDRLFFSELIKDKGTGTYNAEIQFFDSTLNIETAKLAHGFDAVCAFVNDDLSKPVIERLNQLGISLILMRCAGFNNIDLVAAKEKNMVILRVPAYSPYAVAEHAMAILQMANRRLHKAYNNVKDNNYALSGLLGIDLHHKVAGIIGTGKIGECMARICKGYGMSVLAWDAYPNQILENEGLLTYVSKKELFSKADVISLHTPLFPETKHMINKDSIALMKDHVMLVNTARGALINHEDLIEALKHGKFHAVGLDVYEGEDDYVYTDCSNEVMTNDMTARLLMFPQVVLTSHQAFFTQEALQAIAVVTMENARNYNEGYELGDARIV